MTAVQEIAFCAVLPAMLELAGAQANDPQGYRAEFIELVRLARSLRTDWSQRRDRPAD